jgi:hypothetical protein
LISIPFQIEDPQHGLYSDTLYLEDDHTFSDADIEAMKQERFNNWITFITTPPAIITDTPTDEVIS